VDLCPIWSPGLSLVAGGGKDDGMELTDLNPVEQTLWQAFSDGLEIDARTGAGLRVLGYESSAGPIGGDSADDGAGGGRPEVRAEVLRALVLGASESPPGARPALRLSHATVTGRFDLAFANITFPIVLDHCDFETAPDLYWARTAFLSFRGCRLPGLLASNINVDGHLRLSDSTIVGELKLRGATINGALLLNRANLAGVGAEHAMDAERLTLAGDLVAKEDFHAEGTVRISASRISGAVNFDGARISAPQGLAVAADNIDVLGGFYARNATIEGELRLRHGRIAGALSLTGAALHNPSGVTLRLDRSTVDGGVFLGAPFVSVGELRMIAAQVSRTLTIEGHLCNPDGIALRASELQLDGALNTHRRLTAHGEVRLSDAAVTGIVQFENAQLHNPDGIAFAANGLSTGSLLDLCDGFRAHGKVQLSSAKIGGRLCLRDAVIRATTPGAALTLFRLSAVEAVLLFAAPVEGAIDLRYADIGLLKDDPATWPTEIRLDGLNYGRLEPMLTAAQRLRWLRCDSDGYLPSAYEQLAAAYRKLGDDADARAVLLAKHRERRATQPRRARTWGWLQDITVGYGYRPLRAFGWLGALIGVGAVLFSIHRPMPTDPASTLRLDPVLYSLDVLLPIIDLGQEKAFAPATSGQQWLTGIFILAGWTLATTIAAGATRSLRRE
jgi:hypothetical protein